MDSPQQESKAAQEQASRTVVEGLLPVDKRRALTAAVLIASTALSGCTALPHNEPCPGQPQEAPCAQPSGQETGWLALPRWPAVEGAPNGSQGLHMATQQDFIAQPSYTELRAGAQEQASGGPRYYGGGHYHRVWLFSDSGGGSASS